jgi:predicted nucleic-acid-binding Zn-ribbon protein
MGALLGIFDRPPRVRNDIPARYQMAGKEIRCSQCGSDSFALRTALLNTPGMTFFDLDWANRTATVLVCAQCSHLEWFLQSPVQSGA